ncbi:MAG: hypothetical protein H0U57_11910 [Tatlockia sp.]|nr:hypothetical protein [Tatlockia sp.]
MLKIIKNGLVCSAALLSTTCWAENYNLSAIERNFELPAYVAQTFFNPVIWKITAKCEIVTEDSSNVIDVVGLHKTGSVNGIPVSEGSRFPIVVHPSETLTIVADPGAKVQLTNHGPHLVKAHCKV